MHYFPCNVTEMEQIRGNGNVTYSGVKTYHQDLDHNRSGNGSANTSGGPSTNYGSASSKYQTGMTQLTSRPAVDNDQLSEMERAHAKYQIEMEMARQKYQAEIEQAAAKYQSDIEQARGNVGTFIGMKYQQVSVDDMDKAREQEIHYKYQSAFRPSPDLQQQQQQQQPTGNIPVNTSYGSPLEYHQSPTPTSTTTVLNNAAVNAPAPPPAKKRKKKPVDENKIRKRCMYQRRMWTNIEKEAVLRQLGEYFASARLPGKKDIEEALQREDVLATRTWKNIKDFIRNKTTPRIPRRPLPTQVQPLPTQVQLDHQQVVVSVPSGGGSGASMVMTNQVGQMVSVPVSTQTSQLSKQAILGGQHLPHQQQLQQQQQQQQVQHPPPTGPKKRKKKTQTSPEGKQRRVISRRDWSGAEKGAVLHYFGDYVARQKLPGKKEIEECLQKEEILAYRSWRNIKDFIRNTTQAHIKREAIFGTGNPDFALLS